MFGGIFLIGVIDVSKFFAECWSTVGGFALMIAVVAGLMKETKIFKVSGAIFLVFLVADIAFDISPHRSTPTPAPTLPPKVEQPATPQSPKVNYQGRGYDGRSEPNYVDLAGFVAVWYDEQEYLMQNLNYTYTPWQVPTYTRDKQFWVKSDETIDHKTQIVVREQFLTHEGYDNYSGYLRVETSDGRQFFINVRNFVTKPYWTYQKVADALKYGCVIVTYHQRSNFYPVSIDNKKIKVPDGLNLLATGFTGVRAKGFADSSTNQIKINFTPNAAAFFNEDDLSVSY